MDMEGPKIALRKVNFIPEMRVISEPFQERIPYYCVLVDNVQANILK
jgi:hypothetical protein